MPSTQTHTHRRPDRLKPKPASFKHPAVTNSTLNPEHLTLDTSTAAGQRIASSNEIRERERKRTEEDKPIRSIWDVRERLQENFERVEAALVQIESEADARLRLAAAEELRQHIALANKTLETAVRAEAVQAFQEVVLQALEEASATVRRKVIEKLNARAASPDAGQFTPA